MSGKQNKRRRTGSGGRTSQSANVRAEKRSQFEGKRSNTRLHMIAAAVALVIVAAVALAVARYPVLEAHAYPITPGAPRCGWQPARRSSARA